MSALPPLPIDAVLPELRAALAAREAAVLQAPPGAGKTTRVPLALLDAPRITSYNVCYTKLLRRPAWPMGKGDCPVVSAWALCKSTAQRARRNGKSCGITHGNEKGRG